MAIVSITSIKTDRLHLRAPVVSDVESIFNNWASDQKVALYSSWMAHKSRTETARFVEHMMQCWERETELNWIVTLKGTEDAIGGLTVRPQQHSVQIGYALGRAFWNQGYMTEAVAKLIDIIILEPNIYRVWAYCDVQNIASAKVLEKSGMQREGLLRKWAVHPNVEDVPRDCYCYSKVKNT